MYHTMYLIIGLIEKKKFSKRNEPTNTHTQNTHRTHTSSHSHKHTKTKTKTHTHTCSHLHTHKLFNPESLVLFVGGKMT